MAAAIGGLATDSVTLTDDFDSVEDVFSKDEAVDASVGALACADRTLEAKAEVELFTGVVFFRLDFCDSG